MRARFWRNVSLIALGHVCALIALLRWTGNTKAASAEEVTWLSEVDASGAETPSSTPPAEETPEPIPKKNSEAETTPAATSDIVLPSASPTVSATPRPEPKKAPVRPSATSKKKAKPSATPAKKKTELGTKNKQEPAGKEGTKRSTPGSAKTSGVAGSSSAKADAATASYYGNMLHDRFYRAWEQPQTVVASGAKFTAVARIRIAKDGRVTEFKIVQPSGNVLVDDSVVAAGRKVTQVDALPAGIGSGDNYEVNLSFALNPR
ncbi:MAG: hypothetical protein DLM52_01675 [Chthoniobacterales bacterium]|nr:MAG: hypothetical protein DLM52_01675 [Chthoniobacterales bacterium]